MSVARGRATCRIGVVCPLYRLVLSEDPPDSEKYHSNVSCLHSTSRQAILAEIHESQTDDQEQQAKGKVYCTQY